MDQSRNIYILPVFPTYVYQVRILVLEHPMLRKYTSIIPSAPSYQEARRILRVHNILKLGLWQDHQMQSNIIPHVLFPSISRPFSSNRHLKHHKKDLQDMFHAKKQRNFEAKKQKKIGIMNPPKGRQCIAMLTLVHFSPIQHTFRPSRGSLDLGRRIRVLGTS